MTNMLRVLVVADEMRIALLVEDMLIELGHEVVGLAMRLAQALALAENAEIDFAILHVNLDGRMSFPVAEVLEARGVPFVFATGYGSGALSSACLLDRPGRPSLEISSWPALWLRVNRPCGRVWLPARSRPVTR